MTNHDHIFFIKPSGYSRCESCGEPENLKDVIEYLERSNYEREGGCLVNDVVFSALRRLAEKE
jgi:hypothetical protein